MSDKPKRRWFQYSLRTLFVVVTVLAMISAHLAVKIREAVDSTRHAVCHNDPELVRRWKENEKARRAQLRSPAEWP